MTVKCQLTGRINQEENAFRRALNIQKISAATTDGQIVFILGRKMLTVVVVIMMMKTTNTIMNTKFKVKLSFLHFVAF
jgi:hypothetical protein